MNSKIWCRSFLSIYHIIPSIVDSIDRLIRSKSINSFSYDCSVGGDTYSLVDNMIKIGERKVNLLNLRVLTNEILLAMSQNNAKILILKYIDNLDTNKCMELLNLKRRSYFRAVSAALAQFERLFIKRVKSNKVLFNAFNEEVVLDDIFLKLDKFSTLQKDKTCSKGFNFDKSVCNMVLTKIKNAY